MNGDEFKLTVEELAIRRLESQRVRGLGDLIAWLLRWLPAKWKPKNCRCEARQAWLNKRFPFKSLANFKN